MYTLEADLDQCDTSMIKRTAWNLIPLDVLAVKFDIKIQGNFKVLVLPPQFIPSGKYKLEYRIYTKQGSTAGVEVIWRL